MNINYTLRNLYYKVRAIFRPYNVVKIQQLEPTWTDRDTVMFHAMFQILVDFVELEHLFVSWDDRYKVKGRHTNYEEMVKFNEENYAPRIPEDEYSGGINAKMYGSNNEVLYLYKWYKDKKYESSEDWLIANLGQPNYIQEYIKLEAQVEKEVDENLQRLLKIRRYLWT